MEEAARTMSFCSMKKGYLVHFTFFFLHREENTLNSDNVQNLHRTL
jgi:hypothetical protein